MSTPEQPLAPKDALAREATERRPAGLAAIAAGVLALAGGVLASIVYSDFPHVPLLDALRESLGQRPAGLPGLKTAQVLFYDDHSTELLLVSVILAVGSVLTALTLRFLYRATAARSARIPKLTQIAAILGPVLVAVSELALQVFVSVRAGQFADGSDRSTAAAHAALKGGVLVAATVGRQLGILIMGLAFVLLGLNAMRVGLLSRFMGILGIIAGVLFVIPLGSQLPVVQSFWLVAVGFLILGRWPEASTPPAWRTGKAEPWPSQQEVRAQRAEAAEARRKAEGKAPKEAPAPKAPRSPFPLPRPGGGRAAAAAEAQAAEAQAAEAPEEPKGTPHSSSKKKKRKRR